MFGPNHLLQTRARWGIKTNYSKHPAYNPLRTVVPLYGSFTADPHVGRVGFGFIWSEKASFLTIQRCYLQNYYNCLFRLASKLKRALDSWHASYYPGVFPGTYRPRMRIFTALESACCDTVKDIFLGQRHSSFEYQPWCLPLCYSKDEQRQEGR